MAEWKLKRDAEEWPVADAAMLRQWASEGKIGADDYVFNPVLDRWMYAREVAELEGAFVLKKAMEMQKASWGVAGLGCLVALAFWPAGVVLIVIAVCMSAYGHLRK